MKHSGRSKCKSTLEEDYIFLGFQFQSGIIKITRAIKETRNMNYKLERKKRKDLQVLQRVALTDTDS